MTYEQFLEQLAQTPRDWRVVQLGAIRSAPSAFNYDTWACPVARVGGCSGVDVTKPALEMGLDLHVAWRIANAADNHFGHDDVVRADLLKACGLAGEA